MQAKEETFPREFKDGKAKIHTAVFLGASVGGSLDIRLQDGVSSGYPRNSTGGLETSELVSQSRMWVAVCLFFNHLKFNKILWKLHPSEIRDTKEKGQRFWKVASIWSSA